MKNKLTLLALCVFSLLFLHFTASAAFLDPTAFTSLDTTVSLNCDVDIDVSTGLMTGSCISGSYQGVTASNGNGKDILVFTFDDFTQTSASDITFTNGGTNSYPVAILSKDFISIGGRVIASANNNVLVDATSTGITGGPGGGSGGSNSDGFGPETSPGLALGGPGIANGGGGGYGGAGGDSSSAAGGATYPPPPTGASDLKDVLQGGSGGASGDASLPNNDGGGGGGALEFYAETTFTLTSTGQLLLYGATGVSGVSVSGGGGSGGGVRIGGGTTLTLENGSEIHADGGDSSGGTGYGGGGGGGDIYVYCAGSTSCFTDSTTSGDVTCLGGDGGNTGITTDDGVENTSCPTIEQVPEPSTYAMIFGIIAFAGVHYMRRQKELQRA